MSQPQPQPPTLGPVTDSGLYERTDGTVARYVVDGNTLEVREVYPSWSETESHTDRLDRYQREDKLYRPIVPIGS